MSSTKKLTDITLVDMLIRDMATDILSFHVKLNQPAIPKAPMFLSKSRFNFRHKHLQEELLEMFNAQNDNNLSEVVDGLIDLTYIAIGTLIEMGVNPSIAFSEIHRANMAKKPGMTSRGEVKDAMKPEGWMPPDIESTLRNMILRNMIPTPMLEATAIIKERECRYNSSTIGRREHFPLGITSIFQMLWIKILRLRVNIESGEKIDRDHLIDLINYATFGVEIIDE